jgi:hypothetical protein
VFNFLSNWSVNTKKSTRTAHFGQNMLKAIFFSVDFLHFSTEILIMYLKGLDGGDRGLAAAIWGYSIWAYDGL